MRVVVVAVCGVFAGCALLQPVMAPGPAIVDVGPFSLPPRATMRPLVVVLTKTDGYRHESIPAAVQAVERAADQVGFDVVVTQSAAFCDPAILADVDVVVFAHANGRLFTPDQQEALAAWVDDGGGLLLLHGAVGDWSSSSWLSDVIGARFIGHSLAPSIVRVPIRTRAPHPAGRSLPARFVVDDEVYAFEEAPSGRGTVILASLEQGAVVGGFVGALDLTMPDVHPVIWARQIGQGAVVVDTLGHTPSSWEAAWVGPFLADALQFLGGPPLGER